MAEEKSKEVKKDESYCEIVSIPTQTRPMVHIKDSDEVCDELQMLAKIYEELRRIRRTFG